MKRLISALLVCAVIGGSIFWSAALARADPGSTWTQPTAMAVRNVIPAYTPARYHTTAVENFDCVDATYPLAGSSGVVTGCFIPTAFGQMDAEDKMILFSGGKDTVLPIHPFGAGEQILLAWPNSDTVLALGIQNTGGVIAGIYRHFTASLADQTNVLGQVIAKNVAAAPDFTITDASGRPIVFNPNTIAFSEQGSWLVGETLNGHFVRINLATLREVDFGKSFYSESGTAGSNETELGITDDGHYATVVNTIANSFLIYDLTTCSNATCASYNYWSFVDHQLPTHSFISHLRFLNDNLLEFNITEGSQVGSYLLAPSATIGSALSYLGLGDSYSSGEGAGSYLPDTNTQDNLCHLSTTAYPGLIAGDLFTSDTAKSVACSGARLEDIVASNASTYPGQAGDTALGSRSQDAINGLLASFSPGYLPQSRFVSEYQPTLVTLGIGGNDIGFHDILVDCVSLHLRGGNSCYSSYEDRLELAQLVDRQVPRLTQTYLRLKAINPLGNLYIIGYPEIVTEGDCADDVRLDAQEIALANSLVAHLNAALSEAAREAKVPFLDMTQAFNGYRLCEIDSAHSAVHGLTLGTDSGPTAGSKTLGIISNGSYHPTAFGQRLLEQAILAQSHKFTSSSPTSPGYTAATTDTSSLVVGLKTGRQIMQLNFVAGPQTAATAGKSFLLNIDGASGGLRPNTHYELRIDGSAGTVLDTAQTDPDGIIKIEPTLPTTTLPGVHTLDIIGPAQTGDMADIRSLISVAEPLNEPVTSGVTTATFTQSSQEIPSGTNPEHTQKRSSPSTLGVAVINPQSGQLWHMAALPPSEKAAIKLPLRYITWLPYLILGSLVWSCALILRLFMRPVE